MKSVFVICVDELRWDDEDRREARETCVLYYLGAWSDLKVAENRAEALCREAEENHNDESSSQEELPPEYYVMPLILHEGEEETQETT